MFMGGFMDLFADDRDVLAWSSFIGAEAGAWLTAIIGGGQLPLNHGLLVSSGAAWGAVSTALLLAIIHFSGGKGIAGKTWADTLLIAPGIGATALAISTMRYNPTSGQILRADIFGAGVGRRRAARSPGWCWAASISPPRTCCPSWARRAPSLP